VALLLLNELQNLSSIVHIEVWNSILSTCSNSKIFSGAKDAIVNNNKSIILHHQQQLDSILSWLRLFRLKCENNHTRSTSNQGSSTGTLAPDMETFNHLFQISRKLESFLISIADGLNSSWQKRQQKILIPDSIESYPHVDPQILRSICDIRQISQEIIKILGYFNIIGIFVDINQHFNGILGNDAIVSSTVKKDVNAGQLIKFEIADLCRKLRRAHHLFGRTSHQVVNTLFELAHVLKDSKQSFETSSSVYAIAVNIQHELNRMHGAKTKQNGNMDDIKHDVSKSYQLSTATPSFDSRTDFWVEIGFGSGEHLMHRFEQFCSNNSINSQVQLVGVEIQSFRCSEVLMKHQQFIFDQRLNDGPRIKIYNGSAISLLSALPTSSVSKLFLLFPSPPKFIAPEVTSGTQRTRKPSNWRVETDTIESKDPGLLSEQLVRYMSVAMKPGGQVYFASDNLFVGKWMDAHLNKQSMNEKSNANSAMLAQDALQNVLSELLPSSEESSSTEWSHYAFTDSIWPDFNVIEIRDRFQELGPLSRYESKATTDTRFWLWTRL
jgi:tRNA G46 methylase TrmB